MSEIWQEFSCSECKCYAGFMLESSFAGDVEIICGICKHSHKRYVERGRITGDAKTDRHRMVIEILRSACYPAPRTEIMKKTTYARQSELGNDRELARPMTDAEQIRQGIINEAWIDRFSRGQNP